MSQEIGFVFIHGAGLNSSIWKDLTESLNVPCLSVDFPMRMAPPGKINLLRFDEYIVEVQNQIAAWPVRQWILVTHSIGACIGLAICESFRENIKGFVSVAGIIPPSGKSFIAALPFPQRLLMPILLKLFGTKPPIEAIKKELCNDLSEQETQRIIGTFTAESRSLYTHPVRYLLPECPKLYIQLLKDQSVSQDLQIQMGKQLRTDQVATLEAGHLAMCSQPLLLAGLLDSFRLSV